MAQFDVFRNPSTTTRKHYPYLIDIQSPYLEELETRIVIPLGKTSLFQNVAMKRLTPEVTFHDELLLLLTPQISSVSKKQLKEPIGSISHLRDELTNALDFALFGIQRLPQPTAGRETMNLQATPLVTGAQKPEQNAAVAGRL